MSEGYIIKSKHAKTEKKRKEKSDKVKEEKIIRSTKFAQSLSFYIIFI